MASIRYRRTDLAELVAETIRALSLEAGGRRVAVDVPADVVVRVDPMLLRIAIENLVRNSLQHGGNDVRVAVTLLWIARRRSACTTGARAFPGGAGGDPEPFVRGWSAEHGGRGLGLVIKERVVEAHGGTLWLDDADPGSIFRMRIPVGAATSRQRSWSSTTTGSSPTWVASRLSSSAHGSSGRSVRRPTPSPQPLARVPTSCSSTWACPMPAGWRPAAILRSPETVIVALSASTARTDMTAVLKAGFRGYVAKDALLRSVVKAIRSGLDGRVAAIPPSRSVSRSSSDRLPVALMANGLTTTGTRVSGSIVDGFGSVETSIVSASRRTLCGRHAACILTKLQVHSRLEAAAFAVRHGGAIRCTSQRDWMEQEAAG